MQAKLIKSKIAYSVVGITLLLTGHANAQYHALLNKVAYLKKPTTSQQTCDPETSPAYVFKIPKKGPSPKHRNENLSRNKDTANPNDESNLLKTRSFSERFTLSFETHHPELRLDPDSSPQDPTDFYNDEKETNFPFAFDEYSKFHRIGSSIGSGGIGMDLRTRGNAEKFGVGMRASGYSSGVDGNDRYSYGYGEAEVFFSQFKTETPGTENFQRGFAFRMAAFADVIREINPGSCFYWGNHLGYSIRYEDSPALQSSTIGSEFSNFAQVALEGGVKISNKTSVARIGAFGEYRPFWAEGQGIESDLVYGALVKATYSSDPTYLNAFHITGLFKCYPDLKVNDKPVIEAGFSFGIRTFTCDIKATNDSRKYAMPDGDEFLIVNFGWGG